MKIKSPFTQLNSLAAVLVLVGGALLAQNSIRYEAQPGSKVRIDGTSTVHDWTVEGLIIGGFMEWDSIFPLDTSKTIVPDLKAQPKVQATIPVRSLKSNKKAMDEVMHEAMKQSDHPKIEYLLTELTPKKDPHTPGSPFQFDSTGELTVAGVKRTIKMPVSIERVDPKRVKVSGSTSVKMTDFGIKPPAPKLALGLISTGDDVKITFEWITAQRADAAKSP